MLQQLATQDAKLALLRILQNVVFAILDSIWAKTRYVDHVQPQVSANLACLPILLLAPDASQELSSAIQSASPALSPAHPASITAQPLARLVFKVMSSFWQTIHVNWLPISRVTSTLQP